MSPIFYDPLLHGKVVLMKDPPWDDPKVTSGSHYHSCNLNHCNRCGECIIPPRLLCDVCKQRELNRCK